MPLFELKQKLIRNPKNQLQAQSKFQFRFRRLKESPKFFPTCYPEQYDSLPEEEYAEGMFKFTDPTLTF